MIDNIKLRECLVEELDIPKSLVDGIMEKLRKLQPEIAASFEKWFESRQIDNIEVEGYTLEQLMKEKKMNIVSAYLLLDWLKREPEMAKRAIRTQEFANSAAGYKKI